MTTINPEWDAIPTQPLIEILHARIERKAKVDIDNETNRKFKLMNEILRLKKLESLYEVESYLCPEPRRT